MSQSSVFMSFKVLDFSLMGLCGSAWTGRNPPQKKKKKQTETKIILQQLLGLLHHLEYLQQQT